MMEEGVFLERMLEVVFVVEVEGICVVLLLCTSVETFEEAVEFVFTVWHSAETVLSVGVATWHSGSSWKEANGGKVTGVAGAQQEGVGGAIELLFLIGKFQRKLVSTVWFVFSYWISFIKNRILVLDVSCAIGRSKTYSMRS